MISLLIGLYIKPGTAGQQANRVFRKVRPFLTFWRNLVPGDAAGWVFWMVGPPSSPKAKMPAQLNGVGVTVNGKSAFVRSLCRRNAWRLRGRLWECLSVLPGALTQLESFSPESIESRTRRHVPVSHRIQISR